MNKQSAYTKSALGIYLFIVYFAEISLFLNINYSETCL